MTRLERLRSASDKEIAKLILSLKFFDNFCDERYCARYHGPEIECDDADCEKACINWLNAEPEKRG